MPGQRILTMPLSSFALLVLMVAAIPLVRRLAPRGFVDLTPAAFLRAPFSALAFRFRSKLALRRGMPILRNEPKANLFEYLRGPERKAAEKRSRELEQRYDLGALEKASSRLVYAENLYFLDLLDTLASERLVESVGRRALRALDVGSQDFRYATAIERWLSRGGLPAEGRRTVTLTGIELDGYVIYNDLHSRADHAAYHAALTKNPRVTYRVQDFLKTEDREIDVLTIFFPFVLRYALVQWGLPLGAFQPEAFFQNAARVLRPGGIMVILNHTHEERDRQIALLDTIAGVERLTTIDAISPLAPYSADVPERSMTIARRLAK
jgi:SAM-dependent methyltransferase